MENVDNKYEINKELEEVSAGLAKILKKPASRDIPFRYFENLPDQVIDRINTASSPSVSWLDHLLAVFSIRRSFILVVASLLGVVILAGILFSRNPNKELNLASLDDREIRSYLLKNASDLDDDQLSLFKSIDNKMDLFNITEEELVPVMDEYLYQINDDELN